MSHNRTYLIHNTPYIKNIYDYESPYTESTVEYLRYKNIYEFNKLLYYTEKLLYLEHVVVNDKDKIKEEKEEIENIDYMVYELEKILGLYNNEKNIKYHKYDFTYPLRYKMIIQDQYNSFIKNNILQSFLNNQEKLLYTHI